MEKNQEMAVRIKMDPSNWNEVSKKLVDPFAYEEDLHHAPQQSPPINWQAQYSQTGIDLKFIQDQIKEATRLQNKQLEFEKRAEWNEEERDRRKSELDVLTIGEDGKLYVQTVSTRKKHIPRYVANFDSPLLKSYMNSKTCEIAYVVEFNIGTESRRVILHECDLGNMHIFLRKLRSVGASFLVNKHSEELKMASELWCALRNASNTLELIPDDLGWYQDSNNKIRFAKEGDKTWKNIITSAFL